MDSAQSFDELDATVGLAEYTRDDRALDRGTCVGRYVILDGIGRGGMSVVYKAWDPDLNRQIALKLIRTSDAESGSLRERLLREAQALAQLSHPNVLAIYDVGSFGAHVFIATEFVDGKTLRRWLSEGSRSHREILDAYLAAGEGLAAAHRAGLAHRDFKPDNVMMGSDGRVRVLDFGLVRATREPAVAEAETHDTKASALDASGTRLKRVPESAEGLASSKEFPTLHETPSATDVLSASGTARLANRLLNTVTMAGSIMGTPRYMAPEQHLGQAAGDAADQFSFCLSLYEALFGDVPFEGRAEVLAGFLTAPPSVVRVPPRVVAILRRGLHRQANERWPSMDALLAALRLDPAAKIRRVALFVGAALLVTLLLVSGSIALQERRRAEEARLANEFGQEAAYISALARTAAMLPLHDLRPEALQIRERTDRIEAQMKALGSLATGPGHYALGRGYGSLDQWDDSLREYQAAYDAGYRTPALAYGMGLTHGKLYQRALASLQKSGDEAIDAAQRDALARTHREPAQRYLKEASQNVGALEGSAAPEYVQGLLAFYEQRSDEALRLAREAVARNPSLFEAHTLEGDVHVNVAEDLEGRGDVEGALAELEKAAAPYAVAREIARSGVDAIQGECRRLARVALAQVGRGISPATTVNAAVSVCEAGLVVRPADASLRRFEMDALRYLGAFESYHSGDPTPALARSTKLGDAILAGDPDDAQAHLRLSSTYVTICHFLLNKGGNALPSLDLAIEHGLRALTPGASGFRAHRILAEAYGMKFEYTADHGIDARASGEAAVRHAHEMVALAPTNRLSFDRVGEVHWSMAEWKGNHGIDPMDDFKASLEAYQEIVEHSPKYLVGYTNLSGAADALASHLIDVGRDPSAVLERAIENAKRAIELVPNDPYSHGNLGAAYLRGARWERDNGRDPSRLLDAARGQVHRALDIENRNVSSHRAAIEVEIAAVRWAFAQRDDPTSALAAAEREVKASRTDADAEPPTIVGAEAEIYRWRAEGCARKHCPTDALVRNGLELAARSLAIMPDNVDAWLTRAGLHLITARGASATEVRVAAATEARQSVERALVINAFRTREAQPLLHEAIRLQGAH